ncbi:Metallo-hydrolase/oxidoreductase [Martensiomyces pterosporus]|nr:Metallo-hydrolase/oxidoreductase [Martensiomyces pterosporus]
MDKLAAVERVSKSIVRVLGLNPGPFTLQGTNTYIVGHGDRRVLIDTGDGAQPEYFSLLKKSLGSGRIDRIILTHWHADHIGGVSRLLDSADIVTPNCAVYKRKDATIDSQETVTRLLASAAKRGRLFDIADAQVFDVEGLRLRAVYTPGHTDDHMALTVDGEQVGEGQQNDMDAGPLLLTGDLILGQGTTIVHSLQPYMASLERVLGIRPSALLPGHGPVISGRSRGSDGEERPNSIRVIEGYIEHRNMRERQILAVLGRPPPSSPPRSRGWLVREITSEVYPDITDPKIVLAAQNNTRLHLHKLLAEGKAQRIASGGGDGDGGGDDLELWVLVKQKI